MTKRSARRERLQRSLRVAGVALFVAMFALAGLVPTIQNPPPPTDALPTAAAGNIFPEVPAGGVPINVEGFYMHPSGLYSLPKISGWERPADQPEETVSPFGDSAITRAGATFINNSWASVAHAFVEDDPTRNFTSPRDLDGYYDNARLAEAWVRYTGGWKEISRRIENDALIIDTEMYFENQTYLGRQISRLQGRWLMVLRLVAPNNNPNLINQLQAVYVPGFRLWETARAVPLNWSTLADFTAGYAVRYPNTWKQADGGPGRPYTLTGEFSGVSYTLIAQARAAAVIASVDEARAWVTANIPNAVIQSANAEEWAGRTAYNVSYTLADADGNRRSTLITLLAGPESLYTLALSAMLGGRDLLTPEALPGEINILRRTFVIIK